MLRTKTKQAGFTLVELAIVIVIIGLIVGGVLVGQDMIKAAELRAAIGQIEKLDTAVNVFRNKYNGIPGDLANPANFGFTAPSAAATKQGNGVLDAALQQLDEEPGLFFAHLSSANLIPDSISRTTAQVTSTTMTTTLSSYVPVSKLGKGIMLIAQSTGGVNHYMLDNASLAASGALTYNHSAMSPMIAYNVDSKFDDGNPTTGKVMAVDDLTTAASSTAHAGANSGSCVDSTAVTYQTSTQAIGDKAACTIRIRASF